MESSITKTKTIYLLFFLLLSGTFRETFNKLLQNEKSMGYPFSQHSQLIALYIYLSKTFSLIISCIYKNKYKKLERPPGWYKILYLIFPCIFDTISMTLCNISISFLNSSVYQMLSGVIIIFTTLLSMTCLNKKYKNFHFLAIFLIIISLVIIGLNSLINKKGQNSNNILLGIFLAITGNFFLSCFSIGEEYALRKINGTYTNMEIVGYEGLFCVIIYSVILFFSCKIKCDNFKPILRDSLCVYDGKEYRFENLYIALLQMKKNYKLILFSIVYMISSNLFSYYGTTVTKYMKASIKSITNTLRTIFIWIIFMWVPFIPKNLKENLYVLQLVGFIILIVGCFIYYEIISIKSCDYKDKENSLNDEKIVEIN